MDVFASFPSKYLKAQDLPGPTPVTIDEVRLEVVGTDGEDPKPVVYFQGAKKGLVLNVTNANTIVDICGSSESEDWKGQKIVLYRTKTDFGGKRVDCIRIEDPATPPQEPGSDDVPF